MFITLLVVTLLLSTLVAWLVGRAFAQPVERILDRIIDDAISAAWLKYMKFAILVVGISSGVRIHELEQYITAPRWMKANEGQIVALTPERWLLEVYRTVIETLQGIAWLLLAFFVVALLAYVVVRLAELRRASTSTSAISTSESTPIATAELSSSESASK